MSDSSDDLLSEEDSDFQQQYSWNKKTTVNTNKTKTFYRGTHGTLDGRWHASGSAFCWDNSKKSLERYNKRRAGAKAGREGGGSSLRMVKGSTATATSGRRNIKDVLNNYRIPQVIIV